MGESVLMASGLTAYTRVDGVLWCEGVPLEHIAEKVGTPAYVYSADSIRSRYKALAGALSHLSVRLHFAVKSNSNVAVLGLLREMGAGVDIVSGGELHRALAAGFTGADVVFSGVGKTKAELEEALKAGVKIINVESPSELDAIDRVSTSLGIKAQIALRVNPDVMVDSPHPYIKTGEHGMKFGIPDDQVVETALRSAQMKNVELVGLACHMGSQISQSEPYAIAARKLVALRDEIAQAGVSSIRYIDLGGGLGVTYDNEPPVDLAAFAEAITPIIVDSGLDLILEPGRFLVADSGVLLTRVVYRKRSGGKDILISDAGMNDLIRPALYEAYHAVDTVVTADHSITADIVGPVCESGDFFALDRVVGDVAEGELLVLRGAGAYGYSMASNYNSRPKPAEVLVDDDRFAVISRRETYEDLLKLETTNPSWIDV